MLKKSFYLVLKDIRNYVRQYTIIGLEALQTMLIATALTATSIAISVQVLSELRKMKSKEARLIVVFTQIGYIFDYLHGLHVAA